MNQNKIAISTMGSLLGRSLLTVKIDNIDKTFNEKKEKDPKAPRLCSPLKMYVIEHVEVKSVAKETDLEGRDVIVFNGDTKLQFQVAKGLQKPNNDTVKEAIAAAINGETRFFSGEDYPDLFALCSAQNRRTQEIIDGLLNDLTAQYTFLKEIIASEEVSFKKEMADYSSID